jgi:hypothetical protein
MAPTGYGGTPGMNLSFFAPVGICMYGSSGFMAGRTSSGMFARPWIYFGIGRKGRLSREAPDGFKRFLCAR